MNVHEYQAKALFREYGVPVPDGELANTPAEAAAAAREVSRVSALVKVAAQPQPALPPDKFSRAAAAAARAAAEHEQTAR